MALQPGMRIGAYEVVTAIGVGGMGEVYRARDAKLGRDVALKVLPSEFALAADRVARFTREAQVLAALNHQNIAAIYGFEDNALVLEFVDGPTLADRIAQGPIPLDEALPIARQIAEALETAHEQGIIHRDLKPANIKVRPDGTVKVLDFGLAKLIGPPEGGPYVPDSRSVRLQPDLSASPTITTPAMTMAGVILGTAAYMSPEQAKGKPADKRSDIWAFGCVLFEMLTGRRAFEGDDVSDTLAAILRGDPEWSALPADTRPRILHLLQRCLRKEAHKRTPHIAMARFDIEEAAADATSPRPSPTGANRSTVRAAIPIAIATVVAAAITSGVWWALRPPTVAPRVTRFTIPLAESEQSTTRATTYPFRTVAISPEGTHIVYVANGLLNLRSMSELAPTVISGPERGAIGTPVFSPDGQSILYVSARADLATGATLKTISIGGGVPTTIAQLRVGTLFGLSWSAEGIVYGDSNSGVVRVSPKDGHTETLVTPGAGEILQGPSLLPGGRAVLYAVGAHKQVGTNPTVETWDDARIVVRTLPAGEQRTLIEGGSDPRYLPSGHLLYARGGTTWAVPFDVNRLEVTGRPTTVIESIGQVVLGRASTGVAQLDVSTTGSLVYAAGSLSSSSGQVRLVMIDRTGKLTEVKVPPGLYDRPRVSPDGTQVALGSDDPNDANIWIYDLSGKTSIRQLTFAGKNRYPIWTPDGKHVAFQSDHEGDLGIFWQPSDASSPAVRLTKADKDSVHIPESWSPDGTHLLYTTSVGESNELAVYSLETKTSTRFGNDIRSSRLISPTFSPDGHWVAYTVTTGGRNQVFVQPFPTTGAKYLVGSGARPQWSPDGKEIFFYRTEGTFVKTVTTAPSFTLSNEVALPFNVYAGRGPGAGREADIMPDGKRFIAVVASTDPTAGPSGIRGFNVVLNWFEELKQKVRTEH